MATQTTNGKAFEWAVASAFAKLSQYVLQEDAQSKQRQTAFQALSEEDQLSFLRSAQVAAEHIIQKEQRFFDAPNGSIFFQSDAVGQTGDVRDVILRTNITEFGISCKNNHSALKHSRLSDRLDFVKEWGLGNGASTHYWEEIRQAFSPIRSLLAIDPQITWNSLNNKADIYWAVLQAWENEMWRVYGSTTETQMEFCENLMSYLFGSHDFYKVIRRESVSVDIQCCNFRKKLTRPFVKFPTVIRAIDKLNGGQYSKTVVMNNGFSINFRVHNASSRIEPSLKFDIQALSLPLAQFYQQTLGV